jgi:hypothetical protein
MIYEDKQDEILSKALVNLIQLHNFFKLRLNFCKYKNTNVERESWSRHDKSD